MGLTSSENASVLESAAPTQTILSTQPGLPHQASESLPDKPLITIERSKSWSAAEFRDLWAYRELLYFLMWRDLKVRYKQTVIGVAWIVMQPLMTTLIFTVFLGMLARVPFDGPSYPLFVFVGLMPWTFFSNALNSSAYSLVGNAHLITKVYFPRMIVPAAGVGARLVDLSITFVILAALMIYYRAPITPNILMLPVLVALATLLALGFGMLISAVHVKYRDVGVALPVLIQFWMYLSPVVYPSSLVPEKWRVIYDLNPLVGIIDGFRTALFGGPFNWYALAISAIATTVMLIASVYFFRRVEKGFADII
jgi:lipopolysaccharide transport system permease protein